MSDDLIKRADAIEALGEEPYVWTDDDEFAQGERSQWIDDVSAIKAVPSADRPQGKWLLSDLQSQADNDNGNYAYVCTNCNHTDIHAKTQKVPYCWWCGASMKGADNE